MTVLAFSGLSGVGKDTAAGFLVAADHYTAIGVADPLKRIVRDVFDFSVEQLWGPSELRNIPSPRYPRLHTPTPDGVECVCCENKLPFPEPCGLTPRYALQLLGTEWGRYCYDDVWIDLALRTAATLRDKQREGWNSYAYTVERGITEKAAVPLEYGIAFTDIRFKNELAALKRAQVPVIRIKRPGYTEPRYNHPSETEQMEVPDDQFAYILENDGNLVDLASAVARMRETVERDYPDTLIRARYP